MQTKTSYRALKWTLFMGLAASLASACVVTTGDGDDDDVKIDGGEGNTGNTGNRGGSAGTTAGGKGGSGGTGGSTTAGTGSNMGGAGGSGAPTDPDYPGTCESDLATPSIEGSCTVDDNDNDCGKCLKTQCCDEFGACYGQEPTSACGYGPIPDVAATEDVDESAGQFDCIRNCYDANNDGVRTLDEILPECAGECLLQCDDEGLINSDTQDIMDCAVTSCEDECFPPAE